MRETSAESSLSRETSCTDDWDSTFVFGTTTEEETLATSSLYIYFFAITTDITEAITRINKASVIFFITLILLILALIYNGIQDKSMLQELP